MLPLVRVGRCGSADLFAVQERVARRLVDKLEPELGERAARAATASAENLAAQNLYLQGRYHLNQRTEEGLRRALDFFEKALAEDAEYALAHSGLADAYGLLAHYGVLAPAEVWTKAASRAASAVMLDDSSAEAHTSLAHVKADAGLGLGRRRARIPARDQPESRLRDGASLVRGVVPGAARTAR